MIELDGVQVAALASFAALLLGWLVAPSEVVTAIPAKRTAEAA